MGEWTRWDLNTLNKIYRSISEDAEGGSFASTSELIEGLAKFNFGVDFDQVWSSYMEKFVSDETHYYLKRREYLFDETTKSFLGLGQEDYEGARELILRAIVEKARITDKRNGFNESSLIHHLRESGGLTGYIIGLEDPSVNRYNPFVK